MRDRLLTMLHDAGALAEPELTLVDLGWAGTIQYRLAEVLKIARTGVPPNGLYLHSPDTGRHVEPYGKPVATPNTQHLAHQGVLFRQAFCAVPTCSGSRAALLTGLGQDVTQALRAFRRSLGFTLLAVLTLAVGIGASTALLMQEPDRDFVELADLYGGQRARRIWELSAAATRNMIDTLRTLAIERWRLDPATWSRWSRRTG